MSRDFLESLHSIISKPVWYPPPSVHLRPLASTDTTVCRNGPILVILAILFTITDMQVFKTWWLLYVPPSVKGVRSVPWRQLALYSCLTSALDASCRSAATAGRVTGWTAAWVRTFWRRRSHLYLPSFESWTVQPVAQSTYRPAIPAPPLYITFNNSTFRPHSVFVCFVWISEQTAIISLYSINWLVCVTEI